MRSTIMKAVTSSNEGKKNVHNSSVEGPRYLFIILALMADTDRLNLLPKSEYSP